MLKILIAGVAIATSLIFTADDADAFGGRGYARRQARRAHYVAPVVVQRTYVAPVAPVVHYYRAPVYHRAPVSVDVHTGGYRSYYGPGYYDVGHPPYGGGGVSVGIGW